MSNKYQLQSKIKSEGTVQLLAFLGWHYFYLGKIGKGLLFCFTGGGLLIWWFIDLINAKKIARNHNAPIYEELDRIEKKDQEDSLARNIAMIKAAKN